MQLPPGYEAQIRPKSGLAQSGVTVVNSPATIDDDYRGPVQVILQNNHKTHIILVEHGQRFAQIVVKPSWYFQWKLVDELEESVRGEAGFGSTGVGE
jgi:dUTP pyrophosphatase